MALAEYGDLILQGTTVEGTGAASLTASTDTRYNSYAQAGKTGVVVFYTIMSRATREWETGYGMVTAGSPDVLTRMGVYRNSLGTTALINFTAGEKDVYEDCPADKIIAYDYDSDALTIKAGFTAAGSGSMSAGTNASTSLTIGSGGLAPSAARSADLVLNTPDSGSFRGAARTILQRAGTVLWRTGLFAAAAGVMLAVTDFAFDPGTGTPVASITNAGALRLASGLLVQSNGITVTGNSTITGTLSGITTLTATTIVGALTGNASTATALQTPRNINGVAFDGTQNITVTAAAGTLTGTTLNATVVNSSLTSFGTIVSGAVPASLVTAGTFGAGSYVFQSELTVHSITVGLGGGSVLTNTVFGSGSMAVNTVGLANTAIGYQALQANNGTVGLNGSYNTAVGYYALRSNTDGHENSAIGEYALHDNTTGNSNVAVGVALRFNTIGNTNTGMGHGSIYQNVTGSNNTGIGTFSGYGSVVGQSFSGSTFLGAYSGYNITSGSNNTFAGFESGILVTTGANNLLLGRRAGSASGGTSTSLATGSNNIIIGMNIDLPGGAAVSNYLNIGNIIYCTNIDGSGQTHSTGHVLIGSSTTTGLTGTRGLRVEGLIYGAIGISSPSTITTTGGTGFVSNPAAGGVAQLTLNAVAGSGGAGVIFFDDSGVGTHKWRLGYNVSGANFGLYDDTATAGLAMSFTAGTKASTFAGAMTVNASGNVFSAGTDANTTTTLGTGGASPTGNRQVSFELNAPSSGSFIGAARVVYTRAGAGIWGHGINQVVSGAKSSNTDLHFLDLNSGNYVAAITLAGQGRFAGGVFVSGPTSGTVNLNATTNAISISMGGYTLPFTCTNGTATLRMQSNSGDGRIGMSSNHNFYIEANSAIVATFAVGGAVTIVGSTTATSFIAPLFGTITNVDTVFQRNSVTQLTLGSLAATFAGTVATAAPAGGSGAGAWKLGTRISGVFTADLTKAVEIDIGGTLIRVAVLS